MKSPRFPIYISISVSAGILLGILIVSGFPSSEKYSVLGKNSEAAKFNKLKNMLELVHNEYVDTINESHLIEKTIEKTLGQLDPHSSYVPTSELEEETEVMQGNFEGIGIQFRMEEDTLYVVSVIAGGPSQKAGLLTGDRIVKINDSVVAGKNVSDKDIVKKLKGRKGTRVHLSVNRRGLNKLLDFDIIRDVIPTYSVEYNGMLDSKTGYIKITKFSATTHKEFLKALSDLRSRGMQNLILDLRNNGGGYLDQAILLSDEFLPDKELIVYTQGRARKRFDAFATSKGNFEKGKLIIMINEFSASASEIVAGAIQDNDRGLIVGRRSFGKGLVQEQFEMSDGSAIRLTVARYYTPSGRCIQRPYEKGTDEYYHDYLTRFSSGEFESKDSVHFSDTIPYKTAKGRIVYGGGGIMPDEYFPYKRDELLVYYNEVLGNGLIYKFCFDYCDKNRSSFKQNESVENFVRQFNISEELFNNFLTFAENSGVKRNPVGIRKYKFEIITMMKAYIAQNIFGDIGYYKVYQLIDDELQKSLKLMNSK